MQINQQSIRDIKRSADTEPNDEKSGFRARDVCAKVNGPAKRDEAQNADYVAREHDLHADAFDGQGC
jgi:hypothetical protein